MLFPGDEFDDERADWCRQAFAAIAEDEGVLPGAASLLAEVRRFAAAAGRTQKRVRNVSPTEQF